MRRRAAMASNVQEPHEYGAREKGARIRETTMKRQRVASSSIAEIGYAAGERMLEVLFRNGGLYRYFQVPPPVHRALLRADSIGRYMNRRIRNRYRYERLPAPGAHRSRAVSSRLPKERFLR